MAREEIDAIRGVAKGTIRVGAVASISGPVLSGLLERVLERWPGLRVQVLEDVWNNLAEALVRHDVDVVLGVEVADTDDVTSIKDCRWQDTISVVAAKTHPLRRKRRLELADTLQQPWAFMPRGTEPYQQLQRMFAASGLGVPDIVVETRSAVVLKSLVAHSGFLSWLPEPMYGAERKAGLILSLRIPRSTDTRTLTAFRRRAGLLPGPAVKLLEELRRLPNRVPAIFVAIRFDFLLSSLSLCLRFVTLTQFPSTTDFHCFVCRGGLAGTRCNMEADGGRKLVRTSTSWAERQRIIEVGQIV